MKNHTTVEPRSDRELVVKRTFDSPAHAVYRAWTEPALFRQWWAPKSMGASLLSCEMDVRPGGGYRIEFGHEGSGSMAFFGKYTEVTPNARLAWTNDESDQGALTTVSLEEKAGKTLLTLHELHPSKEARDEACAGAEGMMPEQFGQLDALLVRLRAG